MSDNLSVVIQAGGESRRMGRDKGLVPFLGQPLVERVIERIQAIASEILITTNRPENYAFLGIPLFPDLVPGRGALGGLYTALSAASLPMVAVIACDMPFVHAGLLEAQTKRIQETQADIVIPHTGDGMHPFYAIYRRNTCLPHVRAALEAGKWRADAWFNQVRLEIFSKEEILKYDPLLLSFCNLNPPEELRSAEELATNLTHDSDAET
jgi:molybdopterin-guanine dinucleotide biosynthesis protein A